MNTVRRIVVVIAATLIPALSVLPVASAAPLYVDHVEWVKWGDMSSLRVYPTAAGRRASGQPGSMPLAEQAWTEVLGLSPDADQPGMESQFVCHWRYAELVEPGKVSWNLEPWRPQVSDDEMTAAGCNPGGSEEPY